MTEIIDDLEKAIQETAEAGQDLIKKSHVKGYTRTTASGATVQVKEHDDSRQKKTVPPQSDSNRDKWDDLPDDEHPREAMRRIGSKELGNIKTGKKDAQKHAKMELAARGVDEHGKWLGFDKAEQHHGVKTKDMKNPDDDEVVGHFQTLHNKVLGAIASGHTDPKRLASEELANRGHDHEGNWIGFDKAAKLHKVEDKPAAPTHKKRPRLVPNPDVPIERDGNLTIVGDQGPRSYSFPGRGK